MFLAATYLVIAGIGFLVLHWVIARSTQSHLGVVYLRAALALSSCFVAVDLIIVMLFGVWWVPLPLAVGLGFALPGAMLMMT